MKKRVTKFSIFVFLATAFFSFLRSNAETQSECAFCNLEVLDAQKFYEDDLVMALYTHKPVMPGHSLIIPKRHVERFELLSDDEIVQIGRVIKKVNRAAEKVFGASAYLLLQKNGREAGQTVPHVHIHYMPKKQGDDSTIAFILKMYMANFRGPITPFEMCENVEKMKSAILHDTEPD